MDGNEKLNAAFVHARRGKLNMHDPKNEEPVRQPELPKKGEPVQPQPANGRQVGGQSVEKDERGQEQPAEKKRENKWHRGRPVSAAGVGQVPLALPLPLRLGRSIGAAG
jgi:hypothetical protein